MGRGEVGKLLLIGYLRERNVLVHEGRGMFRFRVAAPVSSVILELNLFLSPFSIPSCGANTKFLSPPPPLPHHSRLPAVTLHRAFTRRSVTM